MEKMKVRDLMAPIDQFPRISNTSDFYDALLALEDAQKKFLSGESKQRIVLVEDENGKVVAKISPIDLIRGLEPKFDEVETEKNFTRFGVAFAIKTLRQQYRLWQAPFGDLCRKAKDVQIKDFLSYASMEDQSVKIDDSLTKAFEWFVLGRHDSLFVYDGKEIVGLLRFSDVYKKLSQTIKECSF